MTGGLDALAAWDSESWVRVVGVRNLQDIGFGFQFGYGLLDVVRVRCFAVDQTKMRH